MVSSSYENVIISAHALFIQLMKNMEDCFVVELPLGVLSDLCHLCTGMSKYVHLCLFLI